MLALKLKDVALKLKKKTELKSPKGVYQHVHSIISQNHLQSVILGYKLKPWNSIWIYTYSYGKDGFIKRI